MDPYGWFQWYFKYWLARRSLGNERQINRREEIAKRLKGRLIKIIKDINVKFDDDSIMIQGG